ncbi:hypothetical protein ACFV8Z_30845 [Streptomyces sp. NPDC059837]|uniref:hypothetical protein n=1 Tax=unclassified Streptomyces TaxID=2593676 RepID=UPI00365A7196
MTSPFFCVRNIPSALYKALGGFAGGGVNLTKAESCHMGAGLNASRFYAETEEHADETRVELALQELRFFSTEVSVLGVCPAHAYRLDGRTAELSAGGEPDHATDLRRRGMPRRQGRLSGHRAGSGSAARFPAPAGAAVQKTDVPMGSAVKRSEPGDTLARLRRVRLPGTVRACPAQPRPRRTSSAVVSVKRAPSGDHECSAGRGNSDRAR